MNPPHSAIMLDFEYLLFTKEDPIKSLKVSASKLPIHKKFKIAPHIRRAQAAIKKCDKFRDIITSEDTIMHTDIGTSFAMYFGAVIDKGVFLSIPSNTAKDYLKYVSKNCTSDMTSDKYMERVTKVILHHSDYIDAFVKAFLSIRLAQRELDTLKSN